MAQTIGDQDGITAGANRLRDLDPAGTLLKKTADGKWPNMWDELADVPVQDWKAWDKWQRSFQIVVDDHDAAIGGDEYHPPSPADDLAALAQRIIFCAQDPLAAMGAPSRHIIALTADPGYASFVDTNVINQLRSKFETLASWGVQTQIPAQRIRDFQAQWGLDYCIFQGETDEEYRTAIEAGAEVIVGNANSWTDAHRQDATARINQGALAFTQETYTNLGGPWPEDSSSAGVPCASFTLGVYDGSNEQPGKGWDPSLQAYKEHTPASVWPLVSIYHAAGVDPAEWGLLAP
jgi:hypothetical protein